MTRKIKVVLKVIREILLISLVCIIVFGIFYESRKSPDARENDIKTIRTVLFSHGIIIDYLDSEREMDGPVLWDSDGQESSEEKMLKTAIADWFYINCKQAVNMADTIFRGKVLSRSTETRGLPIYKPDGSLYDYDYYREVTIEVLDMVKGDKSQKTILYKEPGGETESLIFKFDGIDPLNIGQEYIFFLYENNTFLNPSAVMPITDGQVWVSDQMCPEELQVEGERVFAQKLPVDTYMKAIKETYWYEMALKVLVNVVFIGILSLILYFICRNLYKTTRYVGKKVKCIKIGR